MDKLLGSLSLLGTLEVVSLEKGCSPGWAVPVLGHESLHLLSRVETSVCLLFAEQLMCPAERGHKGSDRQGQEPGAGHASLTLEFSCDRRFPGRGRVSGWSVSYSRLVEGWSQSGVLNDTVPEMCLL